MSETTSQQDDDITPADIEVGEAVPGIADEVPAVETADTPLAAPTVDDFAGQQDDDITPPDIEVGEAVLVTADEVPAVETADTPLAAPTVDDLAGPAASLRRRLDEQGLILRQAERAVTVRAARLETNRAKVDQIQQDVRHLTSARDSLATWLQERSTSLGLKLLDHLTQQQARLESDEANIRAWALSEMPSLSARARDLRRRFVRRLFWAAGLSIGIPLVLLAISRAMESNGNTMPVLGDFWWRYLLLGVVLMGIMTLSALQRYHRGYVGMRDEMNARLAHGRFLLQAIAVTRSERARMEGIAPQLRERLEFWGAVLHEPWRVPEYGGTLGNMSRLAQSVPALLQVAGTAHGQDMSTLTLRSKVTAAHFKVGIRREAINSLLAAAARRQGLSPDQADLKAIDRDSSTYGLRTSIFSAVRDHEVLEGVGRGKVGEIAAQVQEGMGPSEDRPVVHVANADALDGLRVSQNLLSEWQSEPVDWDDYVAEILENSPALSRLAFSAVGRSGGRHLVFESIAFAPTRVHSRAGALVSVHPLGNSNVTGTEVVARLDITPPMDVDQVALFIEHADESPIEVQLGARPDLDRDTL